MLFMVTQNHNNSPALPSECTVHFLANENSRSRSLYVIAPLSVVCNVRAPYSGDWNFRQCFYAIWYIGHSWPFGKNFTEIVPGEPIRPGLNATGVAMYSYFGVSNAISRKRCKIWYKLLLITNRKSYMSFRLVPKSVTLEYLERRNSPNCWVISPNSVAFGADYVKVVEDTPILSAAVM